tara:strand:+ start:2700 stop:2918 length:219 start_codon:yes stop_codon:yes gene_type:complete
MVFMRRFVAGIKKILTVSKPNSIENNRVLGRWQIRHDSKVFDKVDEANEDHCGGCNDMRKKYQDIIGRNIKK